MKLGILTFHSQTNYGGVLQAYALWNVLAELGHDVVIIDKWMDARNVSLNGITSSVSVLGWVKFVARVALGFGDGADWIRHQRTAVWLPKVLRLSPYSFFHWKDAPKDMGVDMLVVGSDQVWNPVLQGPELPYLLEGAPKVPAIAYAASFGVPRIPETMRARYADGLRRFSAVSVREQEAVRLVEALGGHAKHVLDPTLLADASVWSRFTCLERKKRRRKLVCYFIQDPLGFVISDLRRFACCQECDVEIFFGTPCTLKPSNARELLMISSGPTRALFSAHVHTRATATPDEFVREISSADWVLTDSFHALMFSVIFKRNVRILMPRKGRGEESFSRLSEFATEHIKSKVLCENVSDALSSFATSQSVDYDLCGIARKRTESLSWLKSALALT